MGLSHVFDSKIITLQSIILDVLNFQSNKDCLVCPIAKQKRLFFLPSLNHMSIFIFDLIHCNVWDPFAQTTQDGFTYFLSIVDDSTRSTWIYLVKYKSKTRFVLKYFYNMICTQFNIKIKAIRIDNAQLFFMKDFFATHDIIHQHSRVATPQQNSVIEKKYQQITSTARALKFQSNAPLYL